MDVPSWFPFVFIGWALLGIGGWWWVSSRTNPADKRRALRIYMISVAIAFALVVAVSTRSAKGLAVATVAIVTLSYLNMSLIKICNGCAALNRPQGFTPAAHCHQCGARLVP